MNEPIKTLVAILLTLTYPVWVVPAFLFYGVWETIGALYRDIREEL